MLDHFKSGGPLGVKYSVIQAFVQVFRINITFYIRRASLISPQNPLPWKDWHTEHTHTQCPAHTRTSAKGQCTISHSFHPKPLKSTPSYHKWRWRLRTARHTGPTTWIWQIVTQITDQFLLDNDLDQTTKFHAMKSSRLQAELVASPVN